MRSVRPFRGLPLALVLLLAAAPAARAQYLAGAPAPAGPPIFFAGGAVQLALPQGEFGDYVDTGFGLDGHLLARLDAAGALGLRLEGSFVNYGNETKRVPISSSIGGRVLVDVETSNNILTLTAGPQLMLPTGRLRPYAHGFFGASYFATESSLEGTRDDREIFQTTNFDDWATAWGGGGGLYVPLSVRQLPVSLDVGVRYQRTDRVRYLREGSIRDNPDGSLSYEPIESETELLTLRLGVDVGLTRARRPR